MADKVLISQDVTFEINLHEDCVRVGVRYVITKFSWMDSLPNFLTHGAPQARASRARELRYNKVYARSTTTAIDRFTRIHNWITDERII